jgi:glucan phosphoethanolaminetransferase (alkaline phosphatase superfamily)
MAASAGFGLAFHKISGSPPSITDIQLLWDGRQDTINAVSFFLPGIKIPIAVALLGFLGIALPGTAIRGIDRFRVAVFILLPLAPLCMIFVVLFTRPHGAVASLPQQYVSIALWTTVIAIDQISERPSQRLPVDLPLGEGRQAKNIVLIVDESIAAGAISLNVSHEITPFIENRAESFINFGVASSASNCSSNTNFLLRFGATPKHFKESVLYWPSIWDYAGRAGYKTLYIDGQREQNTLQNYMTPSERQKIDSVIQLGGLGTSSQNSLASGRAYSVYDTDIVVADIIKSTLEGSERNFIYVVKMGAHFPYDDRYPEEQKVFQPTISGSKKNLELREPFLNSYRNAVRWTVDRFFQHLLSGLDLADSIIIYTSDHGQALLENGRTQTHCSGSRPQISEALVPLMVLTENAYWKNAFKLAATRNFDRASHFNIFPTLLNLMGFQWDAASKRYGASLFDRIEDSRAFSYGDIFGIFGREVRWKQVPPDFTVVDLSATKEMPPSGTE